MKILGISCYYHDSAACLLVDGKLICAAQEERFTRKKHDTSFPINAIKYCLGSQSLTIDDIDHIGFYEKPFIKFERVLSQHLEYFPLSLKTFLASMPSWLTQKLRIVKHIKKELKYKKGIMFIDHHLAHAASSFFVSPFEEAAILTVDGVGEWTTTAYGKGKGKNIELKKEITFPSSLGLLYSTITAFLGFTVNNSEYKVMGLSPYGNMNRKTNKYYKKLRQTIDVKSDGSYRLNMKYFKFQYADRMPSKKLEKLLGPQRKPDEKITRRHKDIAAALQIIYEEALMLMLKHVYNETKCSNLVIAGGCGLNSVANGKIISNTPFNKIWIQPDPGDGGACIGAACYIYHSVLGKKRSFKLQSPYLGPKFANKKIKEVLKKNKIKFREFKNTKELLEKTAELLYKNKVIGWFQNRMEWGPRALGARSILANPCNPNAQQLLNEKVKHREKFRPFAPVVCDEDAKTYFKCDDPLPEPTDYMLMVYPIIKKWHKKIPSVTHIDGSGRLQIIRRNRNELYYDLIKKFGKLSGIPILINTSFNIRGEPIVCTPLDAYRCMMGTEIDYLVIDNFLVKREDNPSDIWNSEKYAKD